VVRALASHSRGPGLFPARCHLWVEFVVETALSCLMLAKALTFCPGRSQECAWLTWFLYCSVFVGFSICLCLFFVVVAYVVFLSIPKEPLSQVRTLLKKTIYTGLENFKSYSTLYNTN